MLSVLEIKRFGPGRIRIFWTLRSRSKLVWIHEHVDPDPTALFSTLMQGLESGSVLFMSRIGVGLLEVYPGNSLI